MNNITVQQLKEKLDHGDSFLLIDVREPHEHEEFNIGGLLIPLGSIPYEADELMEHQEKEIVIYCRSGNRSGVAQQYLEDLGFEKVYNLTGGMLAWQGMLEA